MSTGGHPAPEPKALLRLLQALGEASFIEARFEGAARVRLLALGDNGCARPSPGRLSEEVARAARRHPACQPGSRGRRVERTARARVRGSRPERLEALMRIRVVREFIREAELPRAASGGLVP
jgi:hypothetical protein